MGANCLKEEIRLPGRDFKWPESKVKALGAWFFLHPKETLTLNNQEKFLKVHNFSYESLTNSTVPSFLSFGIKRVTKSNLIPLSTTIQTGDLKW